MRVLITGSREWLDKKAVVLALHSQYCDWVPTAGPEDEFVVVHGGARGADTIAAEWAQVRAEGDHRVRAEEHLAAWETGRGAGHARNAWMVSLGADVCLAFPLGDSPGTRGCMRRAAKAGIPVREFAA